MNEHELQRQAKHRLAVLRHAEEVSGCVASTCRYLRQHYHFGPLKISMYFKRYHDIEISQSGV